MKLSHRVILLTSLFGSFYASSCYATVDNNAAVISVRKECVQAGSPINNCFQSLPELSNWLAQTRKPNQDAPLVVNIGPGTFDSSIDGTFVLQCDPQNGYVGYVSFVGAGRQQTVISASSGFAVSISSCTKLSFSDLTIHSYGGSGGGISWGGGGDSTWSNVDDTAQYYGWTEQQCGASKGNHYWFGSRVMAREFFSAAIAYKSKCDVSWFYGSEISETSDTSLGGNGLSVFNVSGNGEVHVYGSAIRAIANVTASSNGTIKAVNVSAGGKIHIHGTGIDVVSSVPNNIVVLNALTGGMIHANVSSYNLSTPSGTVTRIKKDTDSVTHVHAPYLWEHIPDPATIPGFVSVTGADVTTKASGTSDGHPHMLVYDASCLSKWYDTVDKACSL